MKHRKYRRIIMQDFLISRMKETDPHKVCDDKEIDLMIKEADAYKMLTRMNNSWYWLLWYKARRFFERLYESFMIIIHA